jgi:putative solute:sodium symporter small subunit
MPVNANPDSADPRDPPPAQLHDLQHPWLKAALLLLWAAVAFGVPFFARQLQAWTTGPWPLGYWLVAQGAVLMFIAIVVFYAWAMNRCERQDRGGATADAASETPGDGARHG